MAESRYIPGAGETLVPIGIEDIEDYEENAYDDLEYDEYERQCKLREQENIRYLDEFEADLRAAGLKPATINKHLDNVSFYLSAFLTRSAPLDMRAGCYKVGEYLGGFFIRKCMWSTPNAIKSNAASFKKFYKSMLAHGHIRQDDFDVLQCIIKDDLDYWCDLCAEFNDPYSPNPFSPFGGDLYGPLFGGGEEEGDGEGGSDYLDDSELGAAVFEAAQQVLDSLRDQGMTDEQIMEAIFNLDGRFDLEEDLIESDDATVLAKLASTGLPADRTELEELMGRFDAEDEIVEALCERHGIDLDDESYSVACAAVFALQVHWLPDEKWA